MKPLQVYRDEAELARLDARSRRREFRPLPPGDFRCPTDGKAGAFPRRAFVDSGAWFALANSEDRPHPAADAVVREAALARTRLITTNLVLAEVHPFLLFRAGIRAAAAALAHIEASRLVVIEFATAAHNTPAIHWPRKLDDRVITYTDAVSFAVVVAPRCEVVIGFDSEFVAAGFRLWNDDLGPARPRGRRTLGHCAAAVLGEATSRRGPRGAGASLNASCSTLRSAHA